MNFYFNADKEYHTAPILVELTEATYLYKLGTKAWYHSGEDDLWIIHEDGMDILEVNDITYCTTLLNPHSFKFKKVKDSILKVGLERINHLAIALMHVDDMDDVFDKANQITKIVAKLNKEEK